MMTLNLKESKTTVTTTSVSMTNILRCVLLLLAIDDASSFSSVTCDISSRRSSLFQNEKTNCNINKIRLINVFRFKNCHNLQLKPLIYGSIISLDLSSVNGTPEDDNNGIDNDVGVDSILVKERISQTVPSEQEAQNPKSLVEFQPLNNSRDPEVGGAYNLVASAAIGLLAGVGVVVFKSSVENLREILYQTSFIDDYHWPIFLIPALGGIGVSILATFGGFPPGLRGTINEVDSNYRYIYEAYETAESNKDSTNSQSMFDVNQILKASSRFITKPLAAICTLGTGCSLGPEGPSVELGMTLSRIFMFLTPPSFLTGGQPERLDAASIIRRNRLLLSVGAAAGVSAGFNAPLSGVFFALEIVQQAQPPFDVSQSSPSPSPSPLSIQSASSSLFDQDSIIESEQESIIDANGEQDDGMKTVPQQEYFISGSESIAPLLLATVISALVSQIFLGDDLALSLPPFDFKDPLIELPLYLLLGVMSGVVASLFSVTAQFSKEVFDGDAGPSILKKTMISLPIWIKPIIGGLTCGIVGIFFPQILFFGYDTLNTLLANESLSTDAIASLFFAKTFTTAVSVGSGLVGGTFAPSLFLGGMLGAFFHNTVESLIQAVQFGDYHLAEVPAYAMVGAASVLAALFRAPLTASLVLFETTRDYAVLLPLMASAGIGSLVGDTVERMFEERKNRDKDAVSWGDLADDDDIRGNGSAAR